MVWRRSRRISVTFDQRHVTGERASLVPGIEPDPQDETNGSEKAETA